MDAAIIGLYVCLYAMSGTLIYLGITLDDIVSSIIVTFLGVLLAVSPILARFMDKKINGI